MQVAIKPLSFCLQLCGTNYKILGVLISDLKQSLDEKYDGALFKLHSFMHMLHDEVRCSCCQAVTDRDGNNFVLLCKDPHQTVFHHLMQQTRSALLC